MALIECIFECETRGIIILLYYTLNTTLKQTLNGACPTAQRLALSFKLSSNPEFESSSIFLTGRYKQYRFHLIEFGM